MIPGIHASVSGGLNRALDTLKELGLGCGQIFTSNQRQWKGRPVREEESRRYRSTGLEVISHASYLINLASSSARVRRNSESAIAEELERMHLLGIRWTVLHPGAHLGAGEEAGIGMVSEGVRRALSASHPSTGILLENTAGAGTTLGHTFQQLAELLEAIAMPGRTGVCFDTCHAFAAGYDLSTPAAADHVVEELENVLGTGAVGAFHMNDSLGECGSRRDRHAHIGQGLIGLDALKHLASMEVFSGVPGIVETPGSDMDRARDAEALTPYPRGRH